jgi:hypothetical protein
MRSVIDFERALLGILWLSWLVYWISAAQRTAPNKRMETLPIPGGPMSAHSDRAGVRIGRCQKALEEIETVLHDVPSSRLLHGFGGSTWELIALAQGRGYDTRIGFEETLPYLTGVARNTTANLLQQRGGNLIGTQL